MPLVIFCPLLRDPGDGHDTLYPPAASSYLDSQITLFLDVCDKHIVYFDPNGSIMSKHENHLDYQVYTLLVRFTTLLWQNNGRQNGLISRMLFSEL